jgi:FkbM family methyltransferase
MSINFISEIFWGTVNYFFRVVVNMEPGLGYIERVKRIPLSMVMITNIAFHESPFSNFQRLSKIWASILEKLLTNEPIRVKDKNGITLFVNPSDTGVAAILVCTCRFEPVETALVRSVLRTGMTMLDIGANIGYFSLVASDAIGKEGHIIAFEPEPKNFSILMKNIHHSPVSNIEANQVALSDKDGEDVLVLNEVNQGSHHIGGRVEGSKTTIVRTITLDSYLQDLQDMENFKVDFIKMDVEGCECKAIKGAKNVLERDMPMIMMEFYPMMIERCGDNPIELLEILKKIGYVFYEIGESVGSLKTTNIERLIDEYKIDQAFRSNLFMTYKSLDTVKQK